MGSNWKSKIYYIIFSYVFVKGTVTPNGMKIDKIYISAISRTKYILNFCPRNKSQ